MTQTVDQANGTAGTEETEKNAELRRLFLSLGEPEQERALHLLRSLNLVQAGKSPQVLPESQPPGGASP